MWMNDEDFQESYDSPSSDWEKHHRKKSCTRCGKSCGHHQKRYENCVEDVLMAILEAERKAKHEHRCKTSCKQSIDDLLGKRKRTAKNTIPIILYCGCEPFKGTGVMTYKCGHSKKKKFKCIDTFIFKVKDLKHDCATLELLAFKSDIRRSKNDQCNHSNSPCCQIDHKCVSDLVKTGICINVDLSCFCAVTCLDAVLL